MKVLHLINTLSAGGAELHLLTLCRHLKRRGVDVVVACLREQVAGSRSLRSDFEDEQIEVLNLRADSRYDWRFLGRLSGVLAGQRPDILHSHLPRADIAAAAISRTMRSATFVSSVHGIYRDRWFGKWAEPLMRRAYARATGIIAISHAVKGWLQHDLGIFGGNIRVIHYGIEPGSFAGCRSIATDIEDSGSHKVVGSVGRLEPGKGFECLIHAMKKVRKQMPHATLVIAGHDPLGHGEKLRELIAQLKLEDGVRLVGFQKDIPFFLRDVDVFALASRSEGFGQVIIEAMAAGKPVVASNLAPFTEIVVDGATGRLANHRDPEEFARAIVWLLARPERACEMGTEGQRRVHRLFSAERMAEETLGFYEFAAGSSNHERSFA